MVVAQGLHANRAAAMLMASRSWQAVGMVGGGRALERGGPARGTRVVEAGDGRGSEEKVMAKGGKGEVRGGAKGTRLHDEAATGMLSG